MRKFLTLAALLLPTAALAHPGHGTGFIAGLTHPVSGADHILAMVAVGIWAARTGGRALWAAPLTFVGAMLLGGVLGHESMPFFSVEPVILASIIVLGAAVALAARPPLMAALAGLAVFGMAHGYAHGAEAQGTGLLTFAAGFALTTAALHGAGIVLGFGPARSARASQFVGGLTAMAGVALALAG